MSPGEHALSESCTVESGMYLLLGLCHAVLSERDAWVRMPAMKSPCGACTAAMPCPKGRATSLFQRHRAARASLAQSMRIRYAEVLAWT